MIFRALYCHIWMNKVLRIFKVCPVHYSHHDDMFLRKALKIFSPFLCLSGPLDIYPTGNLRIEKIRVTTINRTSGMVFSIYNFCCVGNGCLGWVWNSKEEFSFNNEFIKHFHKDLYDIHAYARLRFMCFFFKLSLSMYWNNE